MQSNLGRGFDNWLYGAVGYSNFRGNDGGKDLSFGQGVFRFKADGSALEFLYQFNNNTWGFGQNAMGDVFGSTANGNPTFYGYLPAHILNPTQPSTGRGEFGGARGGGAAGGGGGGFRPGYRLGADNTPEAPAANVRRISSAKSMAPGMRMHPNTPNVRMVDTSAATPPRPVTLHGQRRAAAAPARQGARYRADGQAHRHSGHSARRRRLHGARRRQPPRQH
jgi:hypothetical protein